MQSNILLVVLDAVRRDHLCCYGHGRETTPTLDEFASNATRYDSAFAAAPWTGPSHASMFTGLYPSHHGMLIGQPHLSPDIPVIAEELSRAGYTTIGYSNSYYTGVESGLGRGFDHFHDLLELPRIAGRMYEFSVPYLKFFVRYLLRDDDISYFQMEKLKQDIGSVDEPFFAFINLNSAHSPYDPPERYRERFEEGFDRWNDVDLSAALDVSAHGGVISNHGGYDYMMGSLELGEAEWDLIKRWYDGEIAYLDDCLASLFKFLRNRGLYEDTVIVVTSDHGEHFGERGLAYHQFSLSDVLINVPLLIKWPGASSGKWTGELVSLVDLAPTLLEAADVEPSQSFDGRSLLSDDEPEAVFAELGRPYSGLRERIREYGSTFDTFDKGLQAVRTSRHKLVVDTRKGHQLYEIKAGEETPIEDTELTRSLSARIESNLADHPEEVIADDVDDHVAEHLRKLGYM